MRRFAHIINPVKVGEESDLFRAQPITFASMKTAKRFAKNETEIALFSAQYPEDRGIVPGFLTCTSDLDRSVLDLHDFKAQRKLPLIADILQRLYESAPEADFLIYSNVDIGLMPYFYSSVNNRVSLGYDALSVTRRTVPASDCKHDSLAAIYAHAGQAHPGHDCFVFKREALQNCYLAETCVGANYVGKVLLLNLLVHAANFVIFKDLHLTFHLGDERPWKGDRFKDYEDHNRRQLQRVLQHFAGLGQLPDHRLVHRFWATAEGGYWASLERLLGDRFDFVFALHFKRLMSAHQKKRKES